MQMTCIICLKIALLNTIKHLIHLDVLYSVSRNVGCSFVVCEAVVNFQQCVGCYVIFIVSLHTSSLASALSLCTQHNRCFITVLWHQCPSVFRSFVQCLPGICFNSVMNCIKAELDLLLRNLIPFVLLLKALCFLLPMFLSFASLCICHNEKPLHNTSFPGIRSLKWKWYKETRAHISTSWSTYLEKSNRITEWLMLKGSYRAHLA